MIIVKNNDLTLWLEKAIPLNTNPDRISKPCPFCGNHIQYPIIVSREHYEAMEGILTFGEKYLYKWWMRACNNLGVQGVHLYGGSKHSSTTALPDEGFTPEEIQSYGTGHLSKSFRRYFDTNDEQSRRLYQSSLPKKRSNNVVEFDPALTLKNGTKKEV